MRPVLTATVHDPGGHFLPGLSRLAPTLRQVFDGIAVQATTQTAPSVVDALTEGLDATVGQAPADGRVGLHRRLAVGLALPAESTVVHIDLDHILRWIEQDRSELERVLARAADVDFLVVGRADEAMAACPRRLRETEAIVNYVYELVTGHRWDLMFAVRMMSPACAASIVQHCTEDTIGNDIEWPLYAERAGFSVDYAEAAGLSYRTRADFDTAADTHDAHPAHWLNRIDILGQHASVLRRFL